MKSIGVAAVGRGRVVDYLELTKPRITALVLVTAAVGFYMAAGRTVPGLLFVHAMVGTALVAGGASALNQYIERDRDARMRRTRLRPLPDGRLAEAEAFAFSSAIGAGGVAYLAVFTNVRTASLAALTLVLYVLVYTPLKPRTRWATLIGAVPGAAPPLLGWTAAGGALDGMAAALFGIVFLWQMPHFLSIAWLYDSDYVRGGFVELGIGPGRADSAAREIILYCSALVPVSVLPASFGAAGSMYVFGALVAGLVYLGYGVALAVFRSPVAARRLLKASVLYLPAVFALLVIDRVA